MSSRKVSLKKQIKRIKRISKECEIKKKSAILKLKREIIREAKKRLMREKVRFAEPITASAKNWKDYKVIAVMIVDKIQFSKDQDVIFEVYGSSPYAVVKTDSPDFVDRYCVEVTEKMLIQIIS